MKTCRACGYTRRAEDVAPDYECPKCGRVYAKSEERFKRLVQGATDAEPTAAKEPEQQEKPAEQSTAGAAVVLIAIVIAAGYFGFGYVEQWQEDRAAAKVALERQAEAQRRQAERDAERARLAREQAARESDPAYIEQQRRERRALELAREREALHAQRARSQAESLVSVAGIHNVATRWDELLRLAEATPRIALVGPVQQMQAMRREAAALQVSECVQPGKDAFLKAMDFRISQFLTFMQNHNADASAAIRGYEAAIRDMQRALMACVR